MDSAVQHGCQDNSGAGILKARNRQTEGEDADSPPSVHLVIDSVSASIKRVSENATYKCKEVKQTSAPRNAIPRGAFSILQAGARAGGSGFPEPCSLK